MKPKTIIVPARLDPQGVAILIDQVKFLNDKTIAEDSIFIDARWLEFSHPVGLVVLVDSLKLINFKWPHVKIEMALPRNHSVKDYLSRMDVFERLHLSYNESFTRHKNQGRFLEVCELENEDACDLVAAGLGDIFRERCRLTKPQETAMETAVAEVAQNIFHHSETQVEGMISAQFYPREAYLRVSIIDSGIGIPASLQKQEKFVGLKDRPMDALMEAIKYKTTSRPDHNSGFGLYVTTEILRRSEGGFSVYSGNTKMTGHGGVISFEKVPRWEGTIVNLGFRTGIAFAVDEIYNEMSAADDIIKTPDALPFKWKLNSK